MSTIIDQRTTTTPPLEAEAQAFADANANPPFLNEIGPERDARSSTRPRRAT